MMFVPTVYEHAAALIGKTPSQAAQDERLLADGQLAAYGLYRHDLISVGLDIYNVEAEALGARIQYYEDSRLPSCETAVISGEGDLKRLRVPNPEADGRLPLLLGACERVKREAPVPVSGTLTGPFTLAAILRGFEDFVLDMLDSPEFALAQLQFAASVGLAFAEAYIKRGINIVINESWVVPPLCSPDLYRAFAQPAEKQLIAAICRAGAHDAALICGGNTTPIAKDLLDTGTSLIMADWGCDFEYFKDLCGQRGVSLRANIESGAVQDGDVERMGNELRQICERCKGYEKLVVGCGIVSFGTKPESVLQFKRLYQELFAREQGAE
jgi:uroporphyrinogen decarboxylase